jgi:hypothetical protein
VRVDLVGRSGDDEVDANALSDLQRAAKSLPEPPPDAIGQGEYLATTWAFLHVPITVNPTKSEFDLVNLFDRRAIPKKSNKRLELLDFSTF